MNWRNISILLSVAALLAACTSQPSHTVDGYPDRELDPSDIADAVPRAEPLSKYGNPDVYEVLGQRYATLDTSSGFSERGLASFYGTKFHGRRTSSGEIYDMYKMTAAHKTLPLPTYVEVVNLDNGRSTVVKVNDRGPFHGDRVIDLSYAAAVKLGIANRGTGRVEIRAIDPSSPAAHLKETSLSTAAGSATPGPELYVQAGAFANRANAEKLKKDLHQKSRREVHIRDAQRDGIKLFKVYVGPFGSIAQADNLTSKLRGQGIEGAHTVVD